MARLPSRSSFSPIFEVFTMNSRSLVIVAALAVCAACSSPATAPSLAGNADTSSQVTFAPSTVQSSADSGAVAIFATLAPLGSFEWQVAPRYTALAAARHNAAVRLRKGLITVDQAQQVQADADATRKLLDASVAACAQSDRTGQCTKSAAEARRLLAKADAKLAVLQ